MSCLCSGYRRTRKEFLAGLTRAAFERSMRLTLYPAPFSANCVAEVHAPKRRGRAKNLGTTLNETYLESDSRRSARKLQVTSARPSISSRSAW